MMTVYAHVLPGGQRDAANLFAALVEGANDVPEAASIRLASAACRGGNYNPLTCVDVVSEAGVEPIAHPFALSSRLPLSADARRS